MKTIGEDYNLTMLFIRACKSQDPHKRIKSVYRRFYLYKDRSDYLASILSDICDKYNLLSTKDWIDKLNPSQKIYYIEEDNNDYYQLIVNIMISKIRHSPKSKFPDLIPPIRYRR